MIFVILLCLKNAFSVLCIPGGCDYIFSCINGTSIGLSHLRNNLPCQDYSACLQKSGYVIAAVADGHGAEPYFRSGRGSELAVTIAIMAAEEFIKSSGDTLLKNTEDINRQLSQLAKCIISRWGDEVYEDFGAHPYSEEEIAKLPADWGFDDYIYSVYGSTLLLSAVTEKYWFALQIGDGRIFVLGADGNFNEPVPWDENCFLNATTSICDTDAADEFRHYYSDKLPAAVFLCTDGVSEAYRNKKDLCKVLEQLVRILVSQGKFKGKRVLDKMLPEISEYGNRDDTSLSCIYSKEMFLTKENITPPKKSLK
ncbi:MAG: protein phosphatase 2C domain-containing protein [Ruminococcus sp.]|nr:protein phosphatase 2C domain-containing protein [Ruminococcus sp.]